MSLRVPIYVAGEEDAVLLTLGADPTAATVALENLVGDLQVTEALALDDGAYSMHAGGAVTELRLAGGVPVLPEAEAAYPWLGNPEQDHVVEYYDPVTLELVATEAATEGLVAGVFTADVPDLDAGDYYALFKQSVPAEYLDFLWVSVGAGRTVRILVELLREDTPRVGVKVSALLDGALSSYALTDEDGRCTLNLVLGTYRIVFSQGPLVFSRNAIPVTVTSDHARRGTPILLQFDLEAAYGPPYESLEAAAGDLVQLTVDVAGGQAGVPVTLVPERHDPLAFSVADVAINGLTDENGQYVTNVLKGVPFRVCIPGLPARRIPALSEATVLTTSGPVGTLHPSGDLEDA